MDDNKIEVLDTGENSQNVTPVQVQVPVQPVNNVEPVTVVSTPEVTTGTEVVSDQENSVKTKKLEKNEGFLKKIYTITFIVAVLLIAFFLIIMPLANRWQDRLKTKSAIYNSKYKVLVCSKTEERNSVLSRIEAVKVYHSNKKAKKVDYITEYTFYDKGDEYNKLLEECTNAGEKKEDVYGYSKTCLINDDKITFNKEYDLENFDNTSKVNEQIKSSILHNQNITEIEKKYVKDSYLCE